MTDESTPAPTTSASDPLCCHWCGYELTGLPPSGVCPECGTSYSPQTARTYQPWPSAFELCMRVGWPILLWLIVAGITALVTGGMNEAALLSICFGYLMALAAVINGYFQVRSLLRQSLPDRTRKQGPVAVFRALGTVACVLIGIALILPPLACAACVLFVF